MFFEKVRGNIGLDVVLEGCHLRACAVESVEPLTHETIGSMSGNIVRVGISPAGQDRHVKKMQVQLCRERKKKSGAVP
jgi:hypothetical protein